MVRLTHTYGMLNGSRCTLSPNWNFGSSAWRALALDSNERVASSAMAVKHIKSAAGSTQI